MKLESIILILALLALLGCLGQNRAGVVESPTPDAAPGVISSRGETRILATVAPNFTPQSVEGGAAPGAPPEAEETPIPTPSQWLTYTDADYHFSIQYPDTAVILPDTTARDLQPPALREVRFLEKHLAAGDIPEYEPPLFSIAIFRNEERLALRDWLSKHRLLPGPSETESYFVPGADEGVRVRLRILLAPNEFYYLARGGYIYRLTPLGSLSERMLESFTFL